MRRAAAILAVLVAACSSSEPPVRLAGTAVCEAGITEGAPSPRLDLVRAELTATDSRVEARLTMAGDVTAADGDAFAIVYLKHPSDGNVFFQLRATYDNPGSVLFETYEGLAKRLPAATGRLEGATVIMSAPAAQVSALGPSIGWNAQTEGTRGGVDFRDGCPVGGILASVTLP